MSDAIVNVDLDNWEAYVVKGSPEEIAAAITEAEVALREAKEAYRDDPSEENREEFHKARDVLQKLRRATRSNTSTIVADGVMR